MRKLILGFDMDAIVVDLIRPWLSWYNLEHGENITIDDIKTYKIENHVGKPDKIYDFFADSKRYANCPTLPGAAEGLLELHKDGHDIIIATATAGQTANVKWLLAEEAAPWLNPNNLMVGSRKELLRFDVFSDDAPKNIVKYRNAWPNAQIITIAYPYNQDIKTLVNCYAQDYRDTAKAWRTKVDYIRQVANS
jgi:5'(3')-deoxyribonucleotidase